MKDSAGLIADKVNYIVSIFQGDWNGQTDCWSDAVEGNFSYAVSPEEDCFLSSRFLMTVLYPLPPITVLDQIPSMLPV
jgi:hypothetical protein